MSEKRRDGSQGARQSVCGISKTAGGGEGNEGNPR